MYIGLIDYDALSYPKKFFPNLEIMKLSSYFKKDKNIVKLVLNQSDLDKYSKIYLRKNINDNDYPSSLILNERCTYGGLAFTNNEYLPMGMEIESCVPDLQIYDKYYSNFNVSKLVKEKKDMLAKSCFVRLIYNGEIKNFYKNSCTPLHKGSIFIYDMNLFDTNNILPILNNIGYKTHIKFIYPQTIKNKEIYFQVCREKWNYAKNKIIFNDKIVLNKEFKDFCINSKDFKIKGYFLTGYDSNNTFTENYLKQEINRVLNRTIYSVSSNSKVLPYCNREMPESNYKKILRSIEDWSALNFTSQSYKEYMSDKTITIRSFIDELAKKDSFFRELISINPKKILNLGGKWIL